MEKSIKRISVMPYVKGVLLATSISIVGVLVLAFVYRLTGMSDNAIRAVNQIIKVVSIFFGVIACLKDNKKLGFAKGSLIGFFYTIVTYFVFSLLSSSLTFNMSFVFDLIFGSAIGSICGVLAVNLGKK